MNREDIIRMLREANVPYDSWPSEYNKNLERFAALVAEHERKRWHKAGARAIRMAINIEREACAELCDEYDGWIAKLIRARGETK